MRGDCRSYLKSNDIYRVDVETLLNTSWRKDVVGQGKDASRLTHTNLDIISVEVRRFIYHDAYCFFFRFTFL